MYSVKKSYAVDNPTLYFELSYEYSKSKVSAIARSAEVSLTSGACARPLTRMEGQGGPSPVGVLDALLKAALASQSSKLSAMLPVSGDLLDRARELYRSLVEVGIRGCTLRPLRQERP